MGHCPIDDDQQTIGYVTAILIFCSMWDISFADRKLETERHDDMIDVNSVLRRLRSINGFSFAACKSAHYMLAFSEHAVLYTLRIDKFVSDSR